MSFNHVDLEDELVITTSRATHLSNRIHIAGAGRKLQRWLISQSEMIPGIFDTIQRTSLMFVTLLTESSLSDSLFQAVTAGAASTLTHLSLSYCENPGTSLT